MLRRLLRDAKDLQNAIIFCNRKREVALLHKSLQKHGFSVGALHGDMDQSARTQALDQFRKGEIPLLVASDVAARGLDIPTTSHVFNFDVPHHADDYVHRIGRTGRAGRAGTAISIVAPLDQKSMVAIEKLTGQTIPQAEGYARSADAPAETTDDEQPRQQRGRDGSRGGRNKPRRERGERDAQREPQRDSRRSHGGRGHAPQNQQPAASASQGSASQGSASQEPAPKAAPAPSRAPSIGRTEAPRAPRDDRSEPADHSHLPAFLLRPVRARI